MCFSFMRKGSPNQLSSRRGGAPHVKCSAPPPPPQPPPPVVEVTEQQGHPKLEAWLLPAARYSQAGDEDGQVGSKHDGVEAVVRYAANP